MPTKNSQEWPYAHRLSGATARLACVVFLCVAGSGWAQAAAPVYDVEVEVENLSGERKTDWPVILTVYRIFGRNLPQGTLNPKGYHVFGPDGKEVECMVEKIPPYDQYGNDELAFSVPAMGIGQKLTYRIANTAKDSPKQGKFDLVNNPNNLVKNGGFENGKGKRVDKYSGSGALDTRVKRSGRSSLLIAGSRGVSLKYDEPIALHPGSNYYAGVWCKTENVARHGNAAGRGAHFVLPGFDGQGEVATVMSQCYTRDWNKSRFVTRHGAGWSDWGVEEHFVKATTASTTLRLVLDQKKHFCMERAEGKWWVDDFTLFEQPRVTVRFDKLLKPALKDGCFLFTRPASTPQGAVLNPKRKRKAWCAYPFVHEGFRELDRFGLKGQRVVYFFGLYHAKALSKVLVQVTGGALSGPGGAKIPVEGIDYCLGYHGASSQPWLFEHTQPVDLPDAHGVAYFAPSIVIPADAAPGIYTGRVRVLFDGDKPYREFPVKLRVPDLRMPVLHDLAIGAILMGMGGASEENVRVYAKSGFSSITIFGRFLKYTKLPGGDVEVDLEDLSAKMKMLVKYGIQGGIAPFSDFDLGSRWGGGSLYKKTRGRKERYQREVKRIEALFKRHPDWPRMIYMTWDEPQANSPWKPGPGGREGTHGGPPDPRMKWVAEVCPQALQTADIKFSLFPQMCDNYTMPAFDDTPDFTGPELYRYVKSRGREYGFAGRLADESSRYSPGMLIASSGARYFHCYHLGHGLMGIVDKKTVRSTLMIACGQGMDDLKIYRLLKDSIKEALESKDAARAALAKEAEDYLQKVFAIWNADHTHASPPVPYLGWARSWGYDGFYDDWQERMARYAAALKGVAWPAQAK